VLDIADYASLDLTRMRQGEILKQLLMLKQSKAKVIASKIESHQTLESAKEMGFEYFRGKCFTKPKLVGPTRVPINRLSTLQLVLKLQEPDLKIVELEKIVGCDLLISYKLLQYVNSAAISLPRNIESIGHAIRMVGTERIRAWTSLLLLSKLDDKPSELILTAFVRARMAELLALAIGEKNPASHYMVGLFSPVDALLNIPMPEAIQLLPFSRPVREALVTHEGPMGSVLSCVLAYESGNWKDVRCGRLDAATIRQTYLDAISAARQMAKILKKQ
jgi:EAL and modified HD-GYP domain-containing signal transduction protein